MVITDTTNHRKRNCCIVVIPKLLCLCRYVVDAADRENMAIAKSELHDLLSKASLTGIPLLVIGNKIDKPEAESDLIH